MLDAYKMNDYCSARFRKFYQKKTYLELRSNIKTIAIFKSGGGLGDLTQSVALFSAFRKMFPGAKIIYLGLYQNPPCGNLFKSIPYIDEYVEYTWPGKGIDFKGYLGFRKKYLRKFDLIVDTQSKFVPSFFLWFLAPGYFLSRNVIFSSKKFLLNPRKKVHAVAKMLSAARVLGLEEISLECDIKISQEHLNLVQNYLKNFSGPFISILLGAGHPYKKWPEEKFVILADKLSLMGYQIILIGSESERELLSGVARMMQNKPIIPLIDEPKFGKDPVYSIGLFKASSLAVGCDCGGLHLAAFAGCPVVGIYGPTSPLKSGPLGQRNIVLYKELGCSPCPMKECKIQRRCLSDIEPDEVVKAVKVILRKDG